jgi:hypothetical protein
MESPSHSTQDANAGQRRFDVGIVLADRLIELFGRQDEGVDRTADPGSKHGETLDECVTVFDVTDEQKVQIAAYVATARSGKRAVSEHGLDVLAMDRFGQGEIDERRSVGHRVVRVVAVRLKRILSEPPNPADQAAPLEGLKRR